MTKEKTFVVIYKVTEAIVVHAIDVGRAAVRAEHVLRNGAPDRQIEIVDVVEGDLPDD